ncbi:uncharacterized protein LOC123309605 [Coccinella septempunctata]|uniref:uncharacterized protein LOC123309605 n=1 Tax=Coccinella septempunctata TaxID=41139 RepID=UPI001D0959F4|nr:uncharacterized protein LOC123309605 [Coccinella septempunctata]
MYMKCKGIILFIVFVSSFPNFTNAAFKRCFVCRSRGDLGTCKDKFTVNGTIAITVKGVTAVPCASGWCGKILETENQALKEEEYGIATQRLCLQRGPSDSEDRCAYTKWNYRNVLMCFCKGDLCNSSSKININNYILLFILMISITRLNFIS